MYFPKWSLLSVLALEWSLLGLLRAAEPIQLAGANGGAITFSETNDLWTWSGLTTPQTGGVDRPVVENGIAIGIPGQTEVVGPRWLLVEATPDLVVLEQDAPLTGLRVRREFTFSRTANALRVTTSVRSWEGKRTLAVIGLLDVRVPRESFREMGAAPVSYPLFGQSLFAGIEHVSGECSVDGERADLIHLLQRPRLAVDENWQRVASVVVGWPEPGAGSGLRGAARIREAFLQYLDTVRIKPDRIILHTDSWWTVPLPLTEKNVLKDIEGLYKAFGERTGMFFDTYCVDLGWSDPKTLWGMEKQRFPNELKAINDRLAALGTKMGLWMSPGSGYPEALDNSWLQSQGYELTPFIESLPQVPCFALGGRYQAEFKAKAVAYAQQYGLGHMIFDFMYQRCDVAEHGHPIGPESRYAIDAGLADVLDGVRAVNPNMALEPMVCGYPPSPWWLTKTPFVLGPAGDDLPYGLGPCPNWLESLITARDAAYRAGQESWIMPTQALETFDIIVLSPGEFQNTAVMAIGRGRWFLSTYFKTELMKPTDWDFLAAVVRWARENKSYLVNAWQFGGKPENREAYGYMFRNPAKDLYCVRNPWIEERTIELPASASAAGARDVRMIYPRRTTVGRMEPGARGLTITLAPYETVFLETVPEGEAAPVQPVAPAPVAVVEADLPRPFPGRFGPVLERGRLRYYWEGAVQVPDVLEPELWILVEGEPDVAQAQCNIVLGGRVVEAQRVTSAGQFGAAINASPENWTWFNVPVARGETVFQIDVTVPVAQASIGVFLRGATAVASDPAPETGAVFPTLRADRRAWVQTLQPLRPYVAESP